MIPEHAFPYRLFRAIGVIITAAGFLYIVHTFATVAPDSLHTLGEVLGFY